MAVIKKITTRVADVTAVIVISAKRLVTGALFAAGVMLRLFVLMVVVLWVAVATKGRRANTNARARAFYPLTRMRLAMPPVAAAIIAAIMATIARITTAVPMAILVVMLMAIMVVVAAVMAIMVVMTVMMVVAAVVVVMTIITAIIKPSAAKK